MTPATILIIEDDDLQYEIYEEALAKHNLVRATSGSEAFKLIPKHRPEVLILDHVLNKGELGLDFLPGLKELLPHVPIIVVSGALEVHQQLDALQDLAALIIASPSQSISMRSNARFNLR